MKVNELFEAATPNYIAAIDLGEYYDVPNYRDAPSKDALAAAKKKAKLKFDELKKAHPTKLKFMSLAEANAYVKEMEYPGWPIYAHTIKGKSDFRKARTEPIDFSEWNEPDPTPDDIQLTDLGAGRIQVYAKVTKGPLIPIIRSTAYNAYFAKKKLQNGLGKTITTLSDFKSNKVIINATMAEVEKYLTKAKKDNAEHNEVKARKLADKNDPEKKKEANKFKYELQKQRKQELYDKYGKDIVERVKIKSLIEDGDDGYQWSLWVDGVRKQSGMTLYQAEGEQRMMWAYLLKVSKMSPEELKKEADIAAGWKAYFMMQRLEVELNNYLHQMNQSAKKVVTAGDETKKAINRAKGDPEQMYNDLIAKLKKQSKQ